ncbi:MAG TPA: tetratricopeptide repeat protein [Nannocystaceae bacterium]|nr:tetratricopeptide repeat protein [Nannocystaceae bacterium]
MAQDSSDAAGRPGGSGTAIDSLDAELASAQNKNALRLERGRTIGRYVVLYELGAGGMGVVYAAYDPELDRKIALKLLHADSTSSRGRQRLLREAKAIAKLTHPNVVTVHDVGTYEGRVFVAMEYIDGVTLRQWLRERTRTWPEVLDVMCDAAGGLAAAHAAELIHRDFKPDNVLVDRGGRVVVLDFGLARRAQSHDDSGVQSQSRSGERSRDSSERTGLSNSDEKRRASRDDDKRRSEERPRPSKSDPRDKLDEIPASGDFDVELTRTGALLGTPAYMAPEQHLGTPVDARTDQFAFCVVLWEALYGMRPFKGESATQAAVSVVKGVLEEPPKGAGVPNWLRRVMHRGLSVEAAARFPDMHALLRALRRDQARKVRRGLALATGVVGVGVGAVLAFAAASRDRELCEGTAERLVGVWDDDVRARVRKSFDRASVPYATTAFSGVEQALDEYTGAWAKQHHEACEATHVHHDQSQEMLDLRMSCLRARLGDVGALVAELETADAAVIEHAVEAAESLGRLEACSDTHALAARVRPPEDARTRDLVDRLRTTLADAKAKESMGRYDAALGLAEEVAQRASGLGYPPVLAEAKLRLGSVLERKGDFAAAERELLEAIWHAEASHHESVAADAWVRLVWVSGVERGDTKTGELWINFADAAVQRLGSNELLRATLIHNEGGVRYAQARYDEAFDRYREALELQQRLLGPDDPQVAMTYNHMGNVKIMQNDLATAREYVLRSYDVRRRVLGERHPKVAASINNLAVIAGIQNDHDDALEQVERALAIVGDSGGAEEIVSLTAGSQSALKLNASERAVRYLDRLLELRERAVPLQPLLVANTLEMLAEARQQQARIDEAIALLERAVKLSAETAPRHAAEVLLQVAAIERGRGKPDAAKTAIARAQELAMREKERDPALIDRIAAARE